MPQIREIDIKAVALGFLTDTVGTIAISVALVSAMAAAGISESDIMDRMNSLSGLLLGLIFGLGCTVLGGYVAGRIAKRVEVMHGAIVAGVSLILAVILRESGQPLWFELLGYAAIIPSGMAGGYLAAQHHERIRSEQER